MKKKIGLAPGAASKLAKEHAKSHKSARKVRTLSLDEDIFRAFTEYCEKAKVSYSTAVDSLIESFLDQQNPNWRKK